jgi:hypothetical protein
MYDPHPPTLFVGLANMVSLQNEILAEHIGMLQYLGGGGDFSTINSRQQQENPFFYPP